MYYNERIQWLRDCQSLTQKEIAEYMGIKQQQYARYEKGINVMPVTHLAALCQKFNVSADYILGLIDYPRPLKK